LRFSYNFINNIVFSTYGNTVSVIFVLHPKTVSGEVNSYIVDSVSSELKGFFEALSGREFELKEWAISREGVQIMLRLVFVEVKE